MAEERLERSGEGMVRRRAVQGLVAALGVGVGLAHGAEPPRGGPPARPGSANEHPPLAHSDEERRILGVLDDLFQNQRAGMMNVPKEDARLLRLLTEAEGARHVVEIGTSNGYSGLWFCLALRPMGGRLTTHEIDARRAGLARENFRRAGVDASVSLVEGNAHQTIARLTEPFDVLFLDADKEGYLDYLNRLLPLLRPGGLLLVHNARVPPCEAAFIRALTTAPELETLFLNMHGPGMGVTLKKRPIPPPRQE